VTITVYSKPDCVQCVWTKRKLESKGLSFNEIDVTQDAEGRKAVEASGNTTMPMVVVEHAGHKDVWHGFKDDLIKGLSRDS